MQRALKRLALSLALALVAVLGVTASAAAPAQAVACENQFMAPGVGHGVLDGIDSAWTAQYTVPAGSTCSIKAWNLLFADGACPGFYNGTFAHVRFYKSNGQIFNGATYFMTCGTSTQVTLATGVLPGTVFRFVAEPPPAQPAFNVTLKD